MLSSENPVAAHFGSPFVEQRQLATGDALVDLSHHGIVTVSGSDRLSWLDSMTSQKMDALTAGESVETLLLDPQGHIEFVLRVVDDGETSWLLVDEQQAEPLVDYLNRMRFTLRVEVQNRSASHAALGFMTGGTAEQVIASVENEAQPTVIWHDPWSVVAPGGWQYAGADEHPAMHWNYAEAVVAVDLLPRLAQAVSSGETHAAGLLALEALRVMAWRPSQHAEVDERALPHEFDWLRSSVHLNKGCYRGQETVAKVHNLGHPPRRLALLHLDGSDAILPAHGDLVYVAGEQKPVGRITTAARHFEWGSVALALLKRSVDADVGLEIECESQRIPATQEVIVPPDAGATRNVPRLPRL